MRFPKTSRHAASLGFAFLVAACAQLRIASLSDAEDKAIPAGFHFKSFDGNSLGLWEGEQPVFVYRFGEMSLPGVRAAGVRSSYLHPVYGLDGEVLTDDFPVDHYHHHGLFWGWPHVTIGDRHYDLWKMQGIRIDFQRWLTQHAGLNEAKLGVGNAWMVRDKNVMNEEAWFDVHPVSKDGRYIDVTLSWTPTDDPITLGGAEGKSYGGVSLRFAPRKKTTITVPAGRAAADLLIEKLPWADLSADFGAGTSNGQSGAALFVHPEHPGYPPEWMTREYGLLAVGWPGVRPETLQPGKKLTCRYRLWIHRGAPSAAQIDKVYDDYKTTGPESH